MTRFLGIDYGDVRIGIAVSDALNMTAQPIGTLKNSKTVINEIITIIETHKITNLIIGLPKDQKGNDSKKAKDVRNFVDKLHQQININTEFVDERFSTVAVERHLIGLNMSRKKRKEVIDTQAAMFILQGVLDRK
tara:strand:+ start:70 stop:474 length:405 start_codon:yes stop_codon:yes gene_type:complete